MENLLKMTNCDEGSAYHQVVGIPYSFYHDTSIHII